MQVLFIVILIFSIILHEMAHGYMADWLGDPTARLQGRLTLNPIPHIDPIGSLLLPGVMIAIGAPFIFGWAKPVPFNVFNLKNRKWGPALVAVVGPITNFLIAAVFALILNIFGAEFSAFLTQFFYSIIITNVALAVFNLVPIPPLDGHHILFALLPDSVQHIKHSIGRSSFIILILFVMFGWQIIQPVIFWLMDVLLV